MRPCRTDVAGRREGPCRTDRAVGLAANFAAKSAATFPVGFPMPRSFCFQRTFLDRLLGSRLADAFYLSGDTALAAFHLERKHVGS